MTFIFCLKTHAVTFIPRLKKPDIVTGAHQMIVCHLLVFLTVV